MFFLDYHIRERLLERGIDEHAMKKWITSETTHNGRLDIFSVVNETIWKKSIDYHFPVCECDSILFAHTHNYDTAKKVLEYLEKVLFPLQPKIEIYRKDSWKSLNEPVSELLFKRDKQTVSSTLAFLLVTSEFCADPLGWADLAGEPFFQRAMYNKEITIVPILVNNPRKAKFKIPMGIRSLRSIEFYIKDDIICHDTVKHILQPEVKKRLKKEKAELKNRAYWLYTNVISRLPPNGSAKMRGPQHQMTRYNSLSNQEVPNSALFSDGYSENQLNQSEKYENQSKYHRSISQGRAPDSAYASHESSDYCNESSLSNVYTPRHHNEQLPTRGIKEDVPHPTTNQGRSCGKQNGFVLNGSNSRQSNNTSPSIDIVEAPDLNLCSMEPSPSETSKQLREMTHSQRSQKDPFQNKTLDESFTNGKHQDVVNVPSSRTNIWEVSANNIKYVRPPPDTNIWKEPYSGETNTSINQTQRTSNRHLSKTSPVPIEVECRDFKTMSLQSSNSISHSRTQNISSVSLNHNLSSSSNHHSSGMRSVQISYENNLREALPDPRPISAQSLPWDISSSLHSSHASRSAGEENVHPLAREIKMDKFPSGDLGHSINSHMFTSSGDGDQTWSSMCSSNTSSDTSSMIKTSLNISPVPQKISMNTLPTEDAMNKDPRSMTNSVPDVTQLPLGCLRPSDNFRDCYPSFSRSESDSGRPVGVVKPFAMLDDDYEDNDFTNDLSMPAARPEETYVKQWL